MAHPHLVVLYVALALFVGFLGRKRAFGFYGCFILALFLTPVVMAIALLAARSRAAT